MKNGLIYLENHRIVLHYDDKDIKWVKSNTMYLNAI